MTKLLKYQVNLYNVIMKTTLYEIIMTVELKSVTELLNTTSPHTTVPF